jgi:general secretion pathway protein G
VSRAAQRGITYVEVMATVAVLLIMAAMILPTAKATQRKQKEIALQQALREIRDAIDHFHALCDDTIPMVGKRISKNTGLGCTDPTYPEKLEDLVEGVPVRDDTSGVKRKFLRRIPRDPMTREGEWGLRSVRDRPDSTTWGGTDVYDVYSKSQVVGSNGKKYSEW